MAACARFESINQVKQEWRRTKVLLRGEPPGRNEQAERQGLPPDLERCRLTTAARQGHPHKAGSKVRPPWSRRASQLHYLCWLDADTATWPSCATPRCPPSSPPPPAEATRDAGWRSFITTATNASRHPLLPLLPRGTLLHKMFLSLPPCLLWNEGHLFLPPA